MSPAVGRGASPRGMRRLRRFVIWGLGSLIVLYIGGALSGYLWVRHARDNTYISFMDVALLRWQSVRRGMAQQQFAQAKIEAAGGNHQAAYLAYSFAVNNDPRNVEFRLVAVEFLESVGASKFALTMLEAGMTQEPYDPRLVGRTFRALAISGNHRRILELTGRMEPLSEADRRLIQHHRMEAFLDTGEPAEALRLLNESPDLTGVAAAVPVVARVYWENQERLRALDLLARHVQSGAADFPAFSQLVRWQLAAKMNAEAVQVATEACARYPQQNESQVLRIEALAADSARGERWRVAVESYVREFADQRGALVLLAGAAARNGWAELTRALYEIGALRQADLGLLAMFHSDALMGNRRFREARETLEHLEAQALESSMTFLIQLRHRQVLAAAAVADPAATREYARRLLSLVRNDPGQLEQSRRHFERVGIREAVAEFSGAAGGPESGGVGPSG